MDDKHGKERHKPDDITFLGVLSACSYSGFVDEGRHYFKTMIETWGIEPKIEHYGCMIDFSDVVTVRKRMLDTKTKKRPGRSTIQIEEKIHEFAAGDRSRESAGVIYDVLDQVTREARVQGYMPYFEYVVVNIENEDEYNFMVEDS
ncbi:hypothetical protein RD792_005889 [Penstemon davidsonii]|uniref:Uncharacterized protein n=1 Tax=Penstemon davidsonii TaxID=160366 RepID=A0ABR0DW87_9LAMI|nr:hypothetical protein RD792_005889 [Penstemon davidsonii]